VLKQGTWNLQFGELESVARKGKLAPAIGKQEFIHQSKATQIRENKEWKLMWKIEQIARWESFDLKATRKRGKTTLV